MTASQTNHEKIEISPTPMNKGSKSKHFKLVASKLISINFLFYFIILHGCCSFPQTDEKNGNSILAELNTAFKDKKSTFLEQLYGGRLLIEEELLAQLKKGIIQLIFPETAGNSFDLVLLNHSCPRIWHLPEGKIIITRGCLEQIDSQLELSAFLSQKFESWFKEGVDGWFPNHQFPDLQAPDLKYILLDHKYENCSALPVARLHEVHANDLLWQNTPFKLLNKKPASFDPCPNGMSEARIVCGLDLLISRFHKKQYAYACLDKGYAAFLQGNPESALSSALEGLKLEAKEGHLYNLKGKAEVMLGNYHEALSAFSQAIQCKPDYFDFHLQKGLLEFRLGNVDSAKTDLTASLNLLPSAEALYALGILHLKEGNTEDALNYFKIAATADSPFGVLSAKEASKIALVQDPDSALQIQSEGLLHGYLKLAVFNKSAVALKNITIQLTFYNSQRMPSGRRTVTIHETILPGQKMVKTTKIVPPAKNKNIQTKVQHLQIEEETPTGF